MKWHIYQRVNVICFIGNRLSTIKLTTTSGTSCGGYFVFVQICKKEKCCEDEIVNNLDPLNRKSVSYLPFVCINFVDCFNQKYLFVQRLDSVAEIFWKPNLKLAQI